MQETALFLPAQETDIPEILRLLEYHIQKGASLRKRTEQEIREKISQYYVVRVGEILAGSCCIFPGQENDQEYDELGAFVTDVENIIPQVRQKVIEALILGAGAVAQGNNKDLLSVTANPILMKHYERNGFINVTEDFPQRKKRAQHPDSQVFIKKR